MNEIALEFIGIDFWSRPVYKVQGKELYVGSIEVLFPDEKIAPNNTVEELNEYFRNNLEDLVVFGSSFDSEEDPLGTPIKKSLTIKIIDPS